jgi:ribonuclease BN (tRNA processing enzyme)
VKTRPTGRSSNTIAFLGTSDGLPSPDRHHAALLLRLAGQTILLDCGEPVSHTLKRMAVDFNRIDAVLITHTHSDHVAGLPMLIQSMWLEQRTRPLPVWLPGRALAPLQRWLHACYLFDAQFGFRIRWHALSEHRAARVGAVRITAFRTSHLDATRRLFAKSHPGIGFEAFSLLIEAAGKRLAYSGDLGSAADLQPLLGRPLDLLVVELAHLEPDSLLAQLRDRPVRRVALTHLARTARAQLAELKPRLQRALRPARVSFAADGDVLNF